MLVVCHAPDLYERLHYLCLLVGWMVGRSVGLSVTISLKGGKLHFHATIGALIHICTYYIISLALSIHKLNALLLCSLYSIDFIKVTSYLSIVS